MIYKDPTSSSYSVYGYDDASGTFQYGYGSASFSAPCAGGLRGYSYYVKRV